MVLKELRCEDGRAQAVSRRLPTAEARARAEFRSCGICGGQSGTGIAFLQVLRLLLPILIPSTAPHLSSSEAGTIVADVPSGLSLTPPQKIKLKCEVVDCFHPSRDEVQWGAAENLIMNLRISQKVGNFLAGFSIRTLVESGTYCIILNFT
jgi:hypothetical protein